MAKAMLINPSYLRTYGSNEGGLAFPVYPILSLASLAGAALERGHEVEIVDLSYLAYDPKALRAAIARSAPDVVGVTATTPLVNQMRDISYLVKDISPEILVVGGGAHASALPQETLAQSALDAVAVGEADWAIASLLDGERPDAIAGMVVAGADRSANPPSPLLEDLDRLPMPAWQIYPPECNERITKLAARFRPVTTIEFSRGCIYSCDFCGSKNTMGRGYRKKSPERCAEEMIRLHRQGFREAVVVDDIFTSDNDWAAEVCEQLIRSESKVAWSCTNGIRVDSSNDELFRLMKRAGCYRVYFGLESGNDEILRSFGKGGRATVEQANIAISSARRAGLEPNGFFMVGLSGDTEESMQETISFARGVELETMKCGICVPFPGTPMFHDLHDAKRIRTLDWDAYTVYNDADVIFDHPTLSWDTIKAHFDRFYREVYFKNPRFMLRRLRYMIRTRELFYNVYYTVKFARMLWSSGRRSLPDAYEFEETWRPLDLSVDRPLGRPKAPRAKKATGPGGIDGRVTIRSGPAGT